MARVLVIDDDPLVGKTIRAMLTASGHTVIVADGGRAALPAIETFAFDVVMVDIIMPDISGLDVIRLVREGAPGVPVIAMSGYAFQGGSSDLDYFTLAQRCGASHCLQKPFKPHDLVDAIEACRDGGRHDRSGRGIGTAACAAR